jgi:hypothetical protein
MLRGSGRAYSVLEAATEMREGNEIALKLFEE